MFVRIEKLDLLDGITTAIRATGLGQNQPILKCLLMEVSDMGVRITGNNLDLSIQTKPIPVIASMDKVNGKIALDARVLEGIAKALPVGEVTISADDKHLVVIRGGNGKSEFKLVGSNPEEFPAIDETGKPAGSFSINSGILRRMIRQTIFCTSKDTTKPVLMGAYVKASNGKVEMCAVDGFRIAHVHHATDYDGDDFNVVIPYKTLVELVRFLPAEKVVKSAKPTKTAGNADTNPTHTEAAPADTATIATMYFNDKKVRFFIEGTKIMSSLISGEFINYENMFTSSQGTADDAVKVNRAELLGAIERATLIGERKHPISLVLNGNILRIASRTALGSMDEDVAIESNGKEMAIGFNPVYLVEYLKAVGGEQVEMSFTGSLKPSTMRAVGDENYKYLLVPVRMQTPVVNSLSAPQVTPAPAQTAVVTEPVAAAAA